MGLRRAAGTSVPTRDVDLQELLLEAADILGMSDLTVYLFGSRKDKTGSLRSDIDLLLLSPRRITQGEAHQLWDLEPYLDIFRLDRGAAESIVNESQIRAKDDGALLRLLGAEPLFRVGTWQKSADSYRHQTVLAERGPAATRVPMYDLTDAVPAERADILVVTALAEEYHAVVHALGGLPSDRSTLIRVVDDKGSPWRVRVVNMLEMGSVGAALKTQDAIRRTKAAHVVLVGICAGVPGRAQLLDVIVPKSILYYESAKVTSSGDAPSHDTCECDEGVRSRVASDPRLLGGEDEVPRVLAENQVMACGEKVVSSLEFRSKLEDRHRKLAGIDMESYGVLRAAHAAGRKATVIKSVCDMADEQKSDSAHEDARTAAANALKRFIEGGAFRPTLSAE